VLHQILVDAPEAPENAPVTAAVALRAVAPRLTMLSDAERRLLDEWLDRAVAELSRDPR
jgi:hypothetical protein